MATVPQPKQQSETTSPNQEPNRESMPTVGSPAPMQPKSVQVPTNETPAEIVKRFGGISQAIRGLSAEGWSRSQIAKGLNKRYQHVRNVLITPVKNPGQRGNVGGGTTQQTQPTQVAEQARK